MNSSFVPLAEPAGRPFAFELATAMTLASEQTGSSLI
jgi:hypothetical protein